MHLGLIAMAAAFSLGAAGTAKAQEPGDTEAGLLLAREVCAGCHMVERQQTGGTYTDGVPSFMEIANGPGVTFERLDNILIQPTHLDMPPPPLTVRQRAHVVSYVLSLSER